METWISLAACEIQEFVLPLEAFGAPERKRYIRLRSPLAQSFLETQEIKARSQVGRSQKVFLSLKPSSRASASGVCHKHGQAMEEDLSGNTNE